MRTRYINRTIVSTDVEVMTANPTTKELDSVVVTVSGTYTDPTDKALDKAVRKAFSEAGHDTVFVTVTSLTPVTKAYRMLESQFIQLSECTVISSDEAVDSVDEVEDDEDEE